MFYAQKQANDSDLPSKVQMFDANKVMDPADAFARIEEISKQRKFPESIEAIVKLNVDPTKGDQMIRGTCVLPEGTGKEVKVCVFADSEFHEQLKEVGADFIGSDQIITDIANGVVPFDKIICTQEHIQSLKKFARVLGPKGLMPNAKSGTLVRQDEIVEQVRQAKQGLIEFRVSPEAFIMTKIGLRTFQTGQLASNFDALMLALVAKKPEAVKGRYFLKGLVKTSMGPPLKVDLSKYV